MEPAINEKLLEEKLTALEKARTWSPRVISKLEALVRASDDFALFRVNPLQFAKDKGLSETESVDLFLHGAKLGLFQMNWQLLCPGCSTVLKSFAALKTVDAHLNCSLCQVDINASLDDFIAITFTVSPAVRDIIYNHPETLSVEDFFFKHQFSREAFVPLPGSPRFGDAFKTLLKAMTYIEPGEKKTLELDLGPGLLACIDRGNQCEFYFKIGQDAGVRRAAVSIVDGSPSLKEGALAVGRSTLEIENRSSRRSALALALFPPDYKSVGVQFDPFLSGKKLLTTQAFRDLFHSETTRGADSLGVKDITVLFTDLKGSTELYERIGDLKAFSLVQQHFDRLGKVIDAHEGAIVKTIGDAIMASFVRPTDAVKAALQMLEEIERFNAEYGDRKLILKIGIHKGASIVVTLNDRLDFFGQTVNIASRVQALAGADEILITDEVYSHPRLKELLDERDLSAEKAKLKGIQDEMRVHRVRRRAKTTVLS